ncbi:MAG: carbohydrate-binding domain-containing protein, partial [Clostridia bacterium]|nr:carbohydrate-binding domain-containing protein [Clostridia bacterium]
MKKLISILLILVMSLTVLLCSCNDATTDTNTDTSKDTGSQTTDTSTDTSKDTGTTDTDKKPGTTDNTKPSKPDDSTEYDAPIEHNLKVDNSIKLDVFDNETTFGNEGNTVDYTNATDVDVSQLANNKTYTITKGGVYRIHGKSENGQILVNLKDAVNREVVLVLDNLEMSYKGTKSVIYIEKCDKATIVLPVNTVSTLTDTTNNLEKGVIHVRSSNLVLDGKGTLNINATSEKSRGIFNTKSLTIEGGIYNITTASSHGIQGEEGVTINGGVFNITSAKSGIKTGDYDEKKPLEAVKGTVTINGGLININGNTNGISAYGSTVVNNGKVNIVCKSDGFDVSDSVSLTGGIVIVNADKDGIKCKDVSKVTLETNVVNISKEANVKVLAGNDGIDAYHANVTTSGIVYIKSNVDNKAFVIDPEGSYIIKNHKFTLVDTSKYPDETYYSLESCNGIKLEGNLVI